MTVNVYAWPPVGAKAWMWTLNDPIQVSRSITTGADYPSAAQRRRRAVSFDVGSMGANKMGAGFMESLIELLRGGMHCVRLYSMPIDTVLGHGREGRQSVHLYWSDSGVDLEWTDGAAELLWYDGTILTGTTGTDGSGWSIITVSGLPVSRLVAKPSEFLTVFANEDDATGTTVRVLAPAYSDASGVAVIRLHESPGSFTDARVNIGTRDTGVFRPVSMPRVPQTISGDWTYPWEFREVFADEVGGFTELDPWS